MIPKSTTLPLALAALLAFGCAEKPADEATDDADTPAESAEMRPDPHSYARPGEVSVEHLTLDLEADFNAEVLRGSASLQIANHTDATELHLDTRDLAIEKVTLDDGEEATFTLGEVDPYLGQELTIGIDPGTREVHIDYATSPSAAAVQWLGPEQTAGGEHPFLFTQSQAILARTWVPCQDTPAVRMTYEATVKVPSELLAVMSAENQPEKNPDGIYTFSMPQAIPSYLLALAIGDLDFRSLGPETGVYAEPPVVESAAYEFADTQEMVDRVEEIYGPYRWGRYDILVLPPAFPFGGMENPRLTFATPTILAGDRSLVALIAHELAHSWSGNLVTNANWNDFWLNEGFTVYLERRIMEELRGKDYADMLALLALQDLNDTFGEVSERDTHLKLDLAGRDPDEGMTDVAYDKGYFFLRMIEETVGRERFDAFLKNWFEGHAFESVTTEDFVSELRSELVAGDEELAAKLKIDDWVYGPGLPENAPEITSEAFEKVDAQLAAWQEGKPASELETADWNTHQWLHFLRGLPEEMSEAQMADLDAAFRFTSSGNSEILHAWFHSVIRNGYEPAHDELEAFLKNVGRRKFLKPLYERMAATEEGLAWAREIYAEARPGYHSVSSNTIDEILDWSGD